MPLCLPCCCVCLSNKFKFQNQISCATSSHPSSPLQLGIFLHQLLQAKTSELYCNLGIFSVALALVYQSLTILGMPHFLPGPEPGFTRRCRLDYFRRRKSLAPRCEKLRNVIYGIVRGTSGIWLGFRLLLGIFPLRQIQRTVCPALERRLIFVLIRVVGRFAAARAWLGFELRTLHPCEVQPSTAD